MALKDIKVLIVDDELFFRKVLRDMLEQIGFTVVAEAVDGNDAVEKFSSHRPHVTMMDIFMPDRNGIDAIRDILALDGNAKVLVCTASDYDGDTKAALQVGAKATVMKPFVAKEVYESIRKVLTGK
jgi:two-component system chemotaxis response regulator CheY